MVPKIGKSYGIRVEESNNGFTLVYLVDAECISKGKLDEDGIIKYQFRFLLDNEFLVKAVEEQDVIELCTE
jgi:hypothetical protein